eukprot:g15473.t1
MSSGQTISRRGLPHGSRQHQGGTTARQSKHFGTTEPITEETTPPESVRQERPFLEALSRDFPGESEEGILKRERIIKRLEGICQEWSHEVGMTRASMDETSAKQAQAKIFTFGSSLLGVMTPSSDVDCVCVVPQHITRDHFFLDLYPKLLEHRQWISEVNPVESAQTPLIEMVIEGVSIDLTFAQLRIPTLQNVESLLPNRLLVGLDEKSARGIGGNRVNEMVKRSVPNVKVFQQALRFLKAWSKARGIGSNMLGYFGGITWAILVARVCQLYPNFNAPAIIHRFFKFYCQWQWGWDRPVVLCDIETSKEVSNLRYEETRCTHNVTETTKKVLLYELRRGRAFVQAIFEGTKKWEDLYAKCAFLGLYRQYIRIQLLAKTQNAWNRWEGFVESKLRRLLSAIEQLEQLKGVEMRPWPEKYELGADSERILKEWPVSKQMFIGVAFPVEHFANVDPQQPPDLRPAMEKFAESLAMHMKSEGYTDGNQDLYITAGLREDLPEELRVLSAAQLENENFPEVGKSKVAASAKAGPGGGGGAAAEGGDGDPARSATGEATYRAEGAGGLAPGAGAAQADADVEDLAAAEVAGVLNARNTTTAGGEHQHPGAKKRKKIAVSMAPGGSMA